MTEKKTILFDPETAFYLLKHFTIADEAIVKYLLAQSYFNKQQINAQLAISGSKFYPAFVTNPIELVDKIKLLLVSCDLSQEWTDQKKILSFDYNEKEYPGGIGYDGIIAVSKLSVSERTLISFKQRDNVLVRMVQKKPLPTWHLNVVLRKTEAGEIQIKTVFPGAIAPSLPQICVQSSAEYKISSQFWNDHVFIDC